MPQKSIYLASPLGFATSTRAFMDELTLSLREIVEVINPWDDQRFADQFVALEHEDSYSARHARLAEINRELGRANTASIDAADAVFAILDGVDVDSGTAAEIGYGYARGKYVCGLRTDFRLAGDNLGSIVNLQVQYFIEASGGKVVTVVDDFVGLARSVSRADIAGRSG
jgi:nucleoside 2-deoxyribosyltransferase